MGRKIAKSIILNLQEETITIDGELFDYHVAREMVKITTGVDDMTIVRLPIITEHFEIIPRTDV